MRVTGRKKGNTTFNRMMVLDAEREERAI